MSTDLRSTALRGATPLCLQVRKYNRPQFWNLPRKSLLIPNVACKDKSQLSCSGVLLLQRNCNGHLSEARSCRLCSSELQREKLRTRNTRIDARTATKRAIGHSSADARQNAVVAGRMDTGFSTANRDLKAFGSYTSN